jgi:hypothetical protein
MDRVECRRAAWDLVVFGNSLIDPDRQFGKCKLQQCMAHLMPKVFDKTWVATDKDLTTVLMTQEDGTTPTDVREVSL